MEFVQGIVLFVLGVGAAFLAYFAWQHVQFSTSRATTIQAISPGTAAQA